MAARVVAESLVALILTVILTIAVVGTLDFLSGSDVVTSFVEQAPSTVFPVLWPALGLWAVLVIIGNSRNSRRASAWKFLTNLISALAAGVVNVLIFTVLAFSGGGGWALLLVGIAIAVVVAFLVAAAIALALTHFVFFRHGIAPAQQETETAVA